MCTDTHQFPHSTVDWPGANRRVELVVSDKVIGASIDWAVEANAALLRISGTVLGEAWARRSANAAA